MSETFIAWDVDEFAAGETPDASWGDPARIVFVDRDGIAHTSCPEAGRWRYENGVFRPVGASVR